jgi:flagellar biosynthetic protein FlhB
MPPRDEQGERTHLPTPLRLEEARREGRVARSGDLTAAAVTLAALAALALLGGAMLQGLRELTAACLDFGDGGAANASPDSALRAAAASLPAVLLPVAGLCGVAAVVAVLASVAQVGLLSAPGRVRPQWDRLSPGDGLRRLAGRRSLVRALFTAAKLAAVAGVTWVSFSGSWQRLLAAADGDGDAMLSAAGGLVGGLALRVTAALLALAALDYLYQRWQHRQDLKMTHRQWLEDMRRMGADPQWRRRRRRRAGSVREALREASRTAASLGVGAEVS